MYETRHAPSMRQRNRAPGLEERNAVSYTDAGKLKYVGGQGDNEYGGGPVYWHASIVDPAVLSREVR
jgi:hypothetical protein